VAKHIHGKKCRGIVACWTIRLEEEAKKQFKKLDSDTRKLIQNYINIKILSNNNPRDKGKALTGNKKGKWRYRVNKYRIVCRIQDDVLMILVLQIAKRDEVYDDG
jgi:mRNA interferase RelE/StbE